MKKTPKQMAQALFEVLKDKKGKEIEPLIVNFVKLLQKENKLKWQAKIIEEFLRCAQKQSNEIKAEIISIKPLSASLKNLIVRRLEKEKKAKKINLLEKTDSSLLGGLVIKMGDEVWDFSLKKQFQLLKSKMRALNNYEMLSSRA